jgi:short-subunit dehydrogenase
MEASFLSAVRVAHAALPALRASGGQLVLVGSLLACAPARAAPARAGYAAAKAALHAWAAALRADVAADGVAVTLVIPGPVATPFAARAAAAGAPAASAAAAPTPNANAAPALPAQSAEEVAAVIEAALRLCAPPGGSEGASAGVVFTSPAVAAAAAAEGRAWLFGAAE